MAQEKISALAELFVKALDHFFLCLFVEIDDPPFDARFLLCDDNLIYLRKVFFQQAVKRLERSSKAVPIAVEPGRLFWHIPEGDL